MVTLKDPTSGKWLPGPSRRFFSKLKEVLGELPLLPGVQDNCLTAKLPEDLGAIDDDIKAIIQDFSFSSMRVFQCAFTTDHNSEHLPVNCSQATALFTGTAMKLPQLNNNRNA